MTIILPFYWKFWIVLHAKLYGFRFKDSSSYRLTTTTTTTIYIVFGINSK